MTHESYTDATDMMEVANDQRTHDPQTGDLLAREIEIRAPGMGNRLLELQFDGERHIYVLERYTTTGGPGLLTGIGSLDQEQIDVIYFAAEHAVETHNGELYGVLLFPKGPAEGDGPESLDLDVVA